MKEVFKTILFWAVQLTWGLIDNLLGALLFVVMVATKHKPQLIGNMVFFEAGNGNWGGFNLGFVAVVNKNPNGYILTHEYGHFIQNFFFGPFMLFIQAASAIRYWYRRFLEKYNKAKYETLPGYNTIWFEKQADKLGAKYFTLKYTPISKMRGKE